MNQIIHVITQASDNIRTQACGCDNISYTMEKLSASNYKNRSHIRNSWLEKTEKKRYMENLPDNGNNHETERSKGRRELRRSEKSTKTESRNRRDEIRRREIGRIK